MTYRKAVQWMLAVGVAAAATAGGRAAAQPVSEAVHPTNAAPNPYRAIENFFTFPEGRTMGSTGGIDIDPDGTSIWIHERCATNTCINSPLAPVVKFDASGHVVKTFGGGMIVVPHGFHVDRAGNIWVVDGGTNQQRPQGAPSDAPLPQPPKGYQVFKFSPEGKVLLTLGTAGVAGVGPDTFNQPSAVLTSPSGDIFVADGHGGNSNARIVRFSKDGKFIKAWGKKGSGPGEFDTPHALAMDSAGRLFVADRSNSRIQIFDQDGKFLDEWKQFGRPSGIFIDAHDMLYSADTTSNATANPGWERGIRIGSVKDGKVVAFISDTDPDGTGEGIAVDPSGNIYGALTAGHTLKKYVKK